MTRGRTEAEHFSGCLLGGAVGDALGAAVEFLSIDEIRKKYGASGVTDYDVAYGRRGAITDDTQMTMFTAEGLLRANSRWHIKGICHAPTVIYYAYRRWLHTQGRIRFAPALEDAPDGWLVQVKELHQLRAPGNTCVAALSADRMGTMDEPLNNSKGCGGVMRVAPIGLIVREPEQAFELGCEAAAITHGHPSGYYSAGCFTAILSALVGGLSLVEAIEESLRIVETRKRHEECASAIRNAVALWRDRDVVASPETIQRMGGGWVGEEALAIALYCALHAADDFARGVLLAVNHSGDSDSTGSIAGNLLGLINGVDAIPERWLGELELRREIETLAVDLRTGFEDSESWLSRYPGW